jgi:hypothetical protein
LPGNRPVFVLNFSRQGYEPIQTLGNDMGQKKQPMLISSSSIPGDDMSQNWRGYGLSDIIGTVSLSAQFLTGYTSQLCR